MGEAGEPGGGPGLAVRATPRVRGVLERAAGAPPGRVPRAKKDA